MATAIEEKCKIFFSIFMHYSSSCPLYLCLLFFLSLGSLRAKRYLLGVSFDSCELVHRVGMSVFENLMKRINTHETNEWSVSCQWTVKMDL